MQTIAVSLELSSIFICPALAWALAAAPVATPAPVSVPATAQLELQPGLVTLCVLRRSLSLTTRRSGDTFFVASSSVCSSCVQQNVPNCCALQTFQEFALNKLRKNAQRQRERETETERGGELRLRQVFISLFALRCTESYTRAATLAIIKTRRRQLDLLPRRSQFPQNKRLRQRT